MKVKRCTKCKEIKNVNEFYKDKRHKDRLRSTCKKCANQDSRQWHKKNKEYHKQLNKQWYEVNKEKRKQYEKQWEKKHKKIRKQQHEQQHDRIHFSSNRERTLERDNYRCTECGSSKDLCVHHKDGNNFKSDNPNHSISNLITLCRSCHANYHNGERYGVA